MTTTLLRDSTRVLLPHLRVLVADDDSDLLETLCMALEYLGADVVRAKNGGELIERMAEGGPFGLVVTDVSMPWMSGLQALHTVRYVGVSTPTIVMTGLQGARITEEVRRLGARVAFLRKPFDVGELQSAAERLLSAS